MKKLTMEGEGQQIAVSVPLFLRKLWKMVNDEDAEDIIGWNSTGDGFVIYDQLQFITKLLPKYFKHNNMASFIRQLNFYDFHKIAGLEKDVMQFSHSCFLKDLPETLVFIRRKCTSLRTKLANTVKDEELSEILSGVKELKTKHSLVDVDLKQLKQENAALWNEVNNLRLKHAKQTKIINKIIHFLISYMHSHQTSLSKGKASVGRRNSQNAKIGPTILEIGYHDDEEREGKQNSFTEPGHSGAIAYPLPKSDSFTDTQPAERTLDEILDKVGADINENNRRMMKTFKTEEVVADTLENSQSQILIDSTPSIYKPTLKIDSSSNIKAEVVGGTKPSLDLYSLSQKRKPAQNSAKYNILQNPKENLSSYIDDTQVELNSLQELLNNLNSSELANICNLIDNAETENFEDGKNQVDVCQEVDTGAEAPPESNWVMDNEGSLVEELANVPVESDTIDVNDLPMTNNVETGQYTVEDFPDVISDVLEQDYFTA